jgi:hypothetical protein
MRQYKPMLVFLCLSLGIFLLLILVGPKKMYASCYRSGGNLLYSHCGHQRIANLKPYTDPNGPLDTEMRIGKVGKGYIAEMPINSKRLAFIPTALLIALMLATPIGWKQKATMLGISMAILQGLILIALGISLAEGFTHVQADGKLLLKLPTYVEWMVGRLDKFLSGDMNTTFLMPVLVWVLVVARFADFNKLWPTSPAETEPAEDS